MGRVRLIAASACSSPPFACFNLGVERTMRGGCYQFRFYTGYDGEGEGKNPSRVSIWLLSLQKSLVIRMSSSAHTVVMNSTLWTANRAHLCTDSQKAESVELAHFVDAKIWGIALEKMKQQKSKSSQRKQPHNIYTAKMKLSVQHEEERRLRSAPMKKTFRSISLMGKM